MKKKKPQPKKITKDSAEPKTAIGPPLGMPILDHTEGKAIVVPGAIEKLNERVRARPEITDVTIANIAASLLDHPEDWKFSIYVATHITSGTRVWLSNGESSVWVKHKDASMFCRKLSEAQRKMLWDAGRPYVMTATARREKVDADKALAAITKAFGQ